MTDWPRDLEKRYSSEGAMIPFGYDLSKWCQRHPETMLGLAHQIISEQAGKGTMKHFLYNVEVQLKECPAVWTFQEVCWGILNRVMKMFPPRPFSPFQKEVFAEWTALRLKGIKYE